MLSDKEILHEIELKNIIIDPFVPKYLGPNSYDITLGEWHFREQEPNYPELDHFHNIYDLNSVKKVWGEPIKAVKYKGNQSIRLAPGENILAHTNEFIGGRRKVAAEMHARSSIGRNFLTVCRCAGFGDVGYINRWTLELTNNSRFYHIILLVGSRIGQVEFTHVDRPHNAYADQVHRGKYQQYESLEDLKKTWKPEDMLPRLDLEKE
jgi:dCTP deaminase